MELKDYEDHELRWELSRREMEVLDNESKTLPKKHLPYKEIKSIKHGDKTQIFLAHVDDGSEGIEYLIEYTYESFDSTDEEDGLLIDTVKHAYIKAAEEGGWDARHDDITLGEVGRYSLNLLKIDGRTNKQ